MVKPICNFNWKKCVLELRCYMVNSFLPDLFFRAGKSFLNHQLFADITSLMFPIKHFWGFVDSVVSKVLLLASETLQWLNTVLMLCLELR